MLHNLTVDVGDNLPNELSVRVPSRKKLNKDFFPLLKLYKPVYGAGILQCGPMLKPFLPQLQTTFIKALNDSARTVRLRAAEAMAQLIIIHVRVDPVFTELNNSIKNLTYDTSIR